MRRCYIAGKIGALPFLEYTEKFEKAKKEVEALGFFPISPVDLPHEHGRSWGEYMREDLTELLKCHSLYALRDWRTSPGATLEITTAMAVGIHIIHQ